MRIKKQLLTIAVALMIFFVPGFAQIVPRKNGAPQFSSVYTDLRKDCSEAWSGRDKKEAMARGQDIPQRCKGFGGYFAWISYSAVEEYLSIGKDGDAENFIYLRPKDSNFIMQAGGKIEWRLADGKPFAVIVRYARYRSDDPESGPFEEKNKKGESLIVKGLPDFESIDFELDAKAPGVNQKARDLADAAFREKLGN